MSSPAIEAFLARLYTDCELRTRFLQSPAATAKDFGLAEGDIRAIATIDRDGLMLAAQSYERKRTRRSSHNRFRRWLRLTKRWATSAARCFRPKADI
jgi:hypothetical protein